MEAFKRDDMGSDVKAHPKSVDNKDQFNAVNGET
jgi:hypothetical protein